MKLSIKYAAFASIAAAALASDAFGAAGDLDPTFNPGSGANGTVYAVAVQPDGRVIIGGAFTSYSGVARNHIARLHTDGSLDTTFNPGTGTNNDVTALALQPNGKVIIGGRFTVFNGNICNRIARLNVDGTQDGSFNPAPAFDQTNGASGTIHAIAVQTDGKVVIGGEFSTYRTVSRNGIARLNIDGTLDTSFNPGTGADFGVYAVAPAAGNKVYVGGLFNSFNGVSRRGLVRLNADGSVDTSFGWDGDNGIVNALVIQPDGKLLVGGNGLNLPGPIYSLMRVNPDGSRDTSFEGYGSGEVNSIRLRADGRVIIGGSFGTLRLVRRKADGEHDPMFNLEAQPNERVRSVALTPDGNIVIGGDFTAYDTTSRPRVARVLGTTPPALANISTRVPVSTGSNVAIVGFIISGSGGKEVVLRGIGPSLTAAGVPGALQDPVLELYNSSGVLINSNDNWKDTQAAAIQSSGVAPVDDRESAIRINLGSGSFTAVLSGKNGTTGVGLVEVYALSGSGRLANISTRGSVQTGDRVMIGGFIVHGDIDALVVVRALGPSLTNAGVSGALGDPKVAVYNAQGTLLGFNDDWKTGQQSQLTALGLQPSNDLEAAMVLSLPAGNYTAVVEGHNNTTGVGLVEAYHVQ